MAAASRWALSLAVLLFLGACGRFGAVYPPRPPATPGAPVADPAPARVVTHITVGAEALRTALEDALPRRGDGTFSFMGGARPYRWDRGPLALAFGQGRITVETRVEAEVDLPLVHGARLRFPLEVKVLAEPVVSAAYAVKLQAAEVKVTSPDRRLLVANAVAGLYGLLERELGARVREFTYDLRSVVADAYARVSKPMDLPVGDAHGCAELRVLGVEAGPTVLADGMEKDLALVVAPTVTFPCSAGEPPQLPALANVATLVPGPFTLQVPVAARYDELTRAMSAVFTDGRYYFSKEYPRLYLEKPEVYASQDQLVVKLHIKGPVEKLGVLTDLDGDLFLSGRPTVVDNELRVPDLEPTVETSNFFLSLKAMADGATIRDQARSALRLDLGERLKGVRERLSSDLTFGGPPGSSAGCFRGFVDKVEITGVHPHGSYLRIYVAVTGRTTLTLPCGGDVGHPPPGP